MEKEGVNGSNPLERASSSAAASLLRLPTVGRHLVTDGAARTGLTRLRTGQWRTQSAARSTPA